MSATALAIRVEHHQGVFTLDVDVAAPAGLTALFGHSGSGKTTLVDVVAGLVRPRCGRVVVGGAVLLDTDRGIFVPRHRRRVGYVFQEGRLFPHLTVKQNLLFGRLFAPRGEHGPDIGATVEILGIGPLLGRRPARLSGGEKQRVAIGRALLSKPRLLLMDEPLAALDDARKAEILPYLERLRDEARVPIVYVSHAMNEVARLADTLVVLAGGRVRAAGPVAAVLGRLDIEALAGSRDAGSVLDGTIAEHDGAYGLSVLATPAGRLVLPRVDKSVGARLRVQIRPRDVMIALERPVGLSALNVLPATVAELSGGGTDASVAVRLDCGGVPVVARLTRRSVAGLGLEPGRAVFAVLKSVSFPGGGPEIRAADAG